MIYLFCERHTPNPNIVVELENNHLILAQVYKARKKLKIILWLDFFDSANIDCSFFMDWILGTFFMNQSPCLSSRLKIISIHLTKTLKIWKMNTCNVVSLWWLQGRFFQNQQCKNLHASYTRTYQVIRYYRVVVRK